ncbi:MAG: sigma 54-interacting transcriptional regulator, partial [Deltaproteobacteria bacterium]|nr:sigma 54-interacting transcriptional regulator [Deltaproteobacteria bacterium]
FPFVFVNCEDGNSKLLDTQLFSVQKGTDSYKGKLEKTHIAEGNTFFLTNIECLSKGDQAKLLKLLKSKKSVKKGGEDSSPNDKRIIAATNGNLKILVDKGKFSKELYQKINRRSIHILPLR